MFLNVDCMQFLDADNLEPNYCNLLFNISRTMCTCQLIQVDVTQIIRDSPGCRTNLLVSGTGHQIYRIKMTLRRIDLENVLRIKSNNTIRRFGVRHDPIIKVKLYWIIRNLNITGVGSKQRLLHKWKLNDS